MTGIQGAAKYGLPDLDLDVLPADTGRIVRDQKVFRVGTFTSMHGRTRTWTAEDLELAVQNFYKLRAENIIPNVPVREDHTQSVKDIVAYFTSIRREGDVLLADWEWVDDSAKAKWDAKKYRNRSVEIGQYVTNDGQTYDPVVLGLAFVDHPAVEGLYRIAQSGDQTMTKENETPEEKQAREQKEWDDAVAAQAATAQAAADQAAAAAAAAAAANPPAPAPTPQPVGAHANAQMQVHSFTIGGRQTNDYAAVQAHIAGLETFRQESIDGAKKAFVDKLVSDKIVTGPQGVAFHGLVKTMDADQFAAFQAGFEGMPAANLFGRHDLGDGGGGGAEGDAKSDRISVLEGVVANHRATGISQEDLAKKSSFIELQTLKNS
jgi:hypothetical protein